jgi:hypothetical protein
MGATIEGGAEHSALIGAPELDGGVPFVGLRLEADRGLLVAGRLIGGEGFEDLDQAELPAAEATLTLARARGGHGLRAVSPALLGALGAAVGGPVPAAWAALGLPVHRDPWAGMDTALRADALDRSAPLLDPDGELIFAVPQALVEDELPDVVAALQGDAPPAARRAVVAAAVDRASAAALDRPARLRWAFAMDALAAASDDGPTRLAARHTALALRAGLRGDEIPFIRVWSERALRGIVEAALQLGGPGPLGPRIARARGEPT